MQGHLAGCLGRKTARKNSQAGEQVLFCAVEQTIAPIDGVVQGLVTQRQVNKRGSQRFEAIFQLEEQLVRGKRMALPGGQFNRQRQAVQLGANFGYAGGIFNRQLKSRFNIARPGDKQRHRRRLLHSLRL